MSRGISINDIDVDKLGPDSPLRELLSKKRRAPSRKLEHGEQVRLFQWRDQNLERYPVLDSLIAIPNAGGFTGGFKNNKGRVLQMLREGVTPGVSDVTLQTPIGGYGALWVELKADKGKPTEEQLKWLQRMWLRGNAAYVCTGWEAVRDIIVAYIEGRLLTSSQT